MVLHGILCGRVGRRRVPFEAQVHTWAFLFVSPFLPSLAQLYLALLF